LLNATLNKANETFGRKPDKETFWLLLWIWIKVTRSAERKKTYSSKLLRSKKYTLKTKEMTPSSAFPLEDKRGRD
jgi:hypothetical protein